MGGTDDGVCGSRRSRNLSRTRQFWLMRFLAAGFRPRRNSICGKPGSRTIWMMSPSTICGKHRRLAPGHAAVLIGLYRFYFYKGRLADALTVAKLCLEKAARENRLAADWQQVVAGDAEFSHYENMLPRFYLFTLKGYAYLQMRLGNLEEGRCGGRKASGTRPQRQGRRAGIARGSQSNRAGR